MSNNLQAPLLDEDVFVGGSASLVSSTVNLAKTILGTGMLSLPYAYAGAGLAWGAAFTLVAGAMACFSLYLLGEVAPFGGRAPTLYAVAVAAERATRRTCSRRLGVTIS